MGTEKGGGRGMMTTEKKGDISQAPDDADAEFKNSQVPTHPTQISGLGGGGRG